MEPVLIVGAGPTGLVHALWLTAQGIPVRIIDRKQGPGANSRAMAVQARTLELYRQLDLAESVIAAGHKNPAMNIWARGVRRARVALEDAGHDLSPYPFILVYPQDLHERALSDKLEALGVRVERQTELLSYVEQEGRVEARLRLADGTEIEVTTPYLAACDGAGSTVRKQLGLGFDGGTYRHIFYVADVELSGLNPADEAHIALDGSDFVAVLSYGREGKSRLIGTVRDDRADNAESLTLDDVGQDAIQSLGVKVEKVHWFSHYRVHHRVADTFRQGRVFLMGDAGHVHSPVGGQGMNTGILDAINLAWKIAAVSKGEAHDSLLDTYDTERRTFANELVQTTDRVFTLMTAEGSFSNLMRSYLVPALASAAYKVSSVRELMFKVVSQTSLAYPESPLSRGKAGTVAGGDRLPWFNTDGVDNHEPLARIGWQLHVYGSPVADVHAWAAERGVQVRVFPWTAAYEHAGFARNALYLLRPDGYVGLASAGSSLDELKSYAEDHGLFQAESARAKSG